MIDITKLTHAHIGRKVVDSDKDIGEIYGFYEDQIEVMFNSGKSHLFDPEDLEFYDFPGGLTKEDIGSRWMHEFGTEFIFKGADFTQDGEELLIFAPQTDNDGRRWMQVNFFLKKFTRIETDAQKALTYRVQIFEPAGEETWEVREILATKVQVEAIEEMFEKGEEK